jgi:hypothetical protein
MTHNRRSLLGVPKLPWHLAFDPDGDLPAQLSGLARTLPNEMS